MMKKVDDGARSWRNMSSTRPSGRTGTTNPWNSMDRTKKSKVSVGVVMSTHSITQSLAEISAFHSSLPLLQALLIKHGIARRLCA